MFAVGKLLLLDMECESFKTLVKPSQVSQASRKRKRVVLQYDSLGIPIAPKPNEINTGDTDTAEKKFIEVRLDVPRNFTPVSLATCYLLGSGTNWY
jgi:hypothetical protein